MCEYKKNEKLYQKSNTAGFLGYPKSFRKNLFFLIFSIFGKKFKEKTEKQAEENARQENEIRTLKEQLSAARSARLQQIATTSTPRRANKIIKRKINVKKENKK